MAPETAPTSEPGPVTVTAASGDLPPYNEEAAGRLLDALNDPDWEAKRMAQEPTATKRPGIDLRVLWWLDEHCLWLADRLWALRARRQARKMPGPF